MESLADASRSHLAALSEPCSGWGQQADMHVRELRMREALHQRERNALHGLTHSLIRDMDALRAAPLFPLAMQAPPSAPPPPTPSAAAREFAPAAPQEAAAEHAGEHAGHKGQAMP